MGQNLKSIRGKVENSVNLVILDEHFQFFK